MFVSLGAYALHLFVFQPPFLQYIHPPLFVLLGKPGFDVNQWLFAPAGGAATGDALDGFGSLVLPNDSMGFEANKPLITIAALLMNYLCCHVWVTVCHAPVVAAHLNLLGKASVAVQYVRQRCMPSKGSQ